MVRNLLISLLLVTKSFLLLSQDFEGALSVKFNKKDAPIIVDYGTGFHCIFYNHVRLQYYRLNYDFQIEQEGEIPLNKIGYKPHLLEINGTRKEINVYYKRADSAGIWLLQINTVNNTSLKFQITKELTSKQRVIGNYSIGDTSVFYTYAPNQNINLLAFQGQNIICKHTIELTKDIAVFWDNYTLKNPQLSKTLIDKSQGDFENKLHVGSVKHYFGYKYISVSIDLGYSTTLIQYNRKIDKHTIDEYILNIDAVGIPKSALIGSILKGKYLYQTGLFESGAICQKSDIKFQTEVYNQYYSYIYSKNTGSPVWHLNRKIPGEFVKSNSTCLELHPHRTERYLGINVQQKGPIENFIVSEMEPLKTHTEWVHNSNLISPSLNRRSKQGVISYFALKSSSPLHYSLLQHSQCMTTSFAFSITKSGDISPYLGSTEWPLANASITLHNYTKSGIRIFAPTLAKLNNKSYFCFYNNKLKRYLFIPL